MNSDIELSESQIAKKKEILSSLKQDINKLSKKVNNIEKEKEEHKIVKRKSVEVKPMSEEEAILQMELLGHEFFMFKDADTDNFAVVYKRKDENYGIIESE